MKVTLNWLKRYVDFDWTPDELAERLTMLGLEVEGLQKLGGDFEGIVVAQVLTVDKHPNADKLTVCRVADGQGQRQIVCGAHNFKAGDKVPLILPGYSLSAEPGQEPFTIKVGKIRGVESHGMMCSPKELGISDDAAGLMILPPDAQVGQPFAQFMGRATGDVVFDLEITPNRPDLNSVIGVAREISAATGNPLRLPAVSLPASHVAVDSLVAVIIADPELCPRYTARLLLGVKIGPSPDWLRQTLEKAGQRSINNVVDVTNYVMLEIGQPLHAFDYHLVANGPDGRPTIVVRPAQEGELFIALDGQRRTLTSQMLLIADPHKGIALAGIMGGQNSEINEQTADVLLESAYFKPQNIRATSKKLGLVTDASYRFERGADLGITDWASQRAAQLILETAGGQLANGVVDAFPQPAPPLRITLRHAKVDEWLGVEIPAEQQVLFLQRLGLETLAEPDSTPHSALSTPHSALPTPHFQGSALRTPHSTAFGIPSFRVDLKREIDLAEEIGRLYGVDRIPATPPRGAFGANAYDAIHDQLAEVRRILTGLGLDEAQGQTLLAQAPARLVSSELVALANPLSSDMNVLRPSLLPGLLDVLRHNASRKNENVALFEVGRVFNLVGGQTPEGRRVALALTGQRHPAFWTGDDRQTKWDIHDLKGLLEEFLEQLGVRGANYLRRAEPTPLFLESATIQLGRLFLGQAGLLLPALARQYDLRDAVLLAELDLDQLLARRNTDKGFRALPAFPSIRRDVAMFLPESTTHEAVLNVVKQAKPQNLETVELFDVFRGKNVPAGHKSVAYAFTYRHPERTLTDPEVNAAHEKLVERFKQALAAVVREA
jgi:phenylalanyl-tRNA synthetase beta chain